MHLRQPLPPDQQAIRNRCFHPAGDFSEFPLEATNRPILDRFAEVASGCPSRVAIRTPSDQLTYQQLDRAANRVARAILAASSDTAAPVGLLFDNSPRYVVASLAVLKAARIQLSLESSFPEARLQYVLKQSGAGLVVTDQSNLALAHALSELPIINIDELSADLSDASVGTAADVDDAVAIDYTSGSTGNPKGMVWTHRGLLHVTARHTNVSHICRHDRLVMFRASIRGYLSVLLNGAAFCPIDLAHQDQGSLAEWIDGEGMTIYRAAVSTFRSFVNVLTGKERFAALRLVLLFGEPAYARDLQQHRRYFAGNSILGSSLGCNEMDDYAYFFVDQGSHLPADVMPGGYAVEDIEVLLLDDAQRSVADHEIGEISVRSRYHSGGYWRNETATQSAFISLDESGGRFYRTGDVGQRSDGCLFHLGRKDFQIKIRGYRVDIGTVEAALLALEGVKEAAVTDTGEPGGNNRLVAYVVLQSGIRLNIPELRDELQRQVPAYSVPSIFMVIDSMPMTATGKIDHQRLPPPDRGQLHLDSSFTAPRTDLEKNVAEIWAEVLALSKIGVFDNFLELGGDSLRATQVIARVMERFHVHPRIQALLEAPTVADMARVIHESTFAQFSDAELQGLLSEMDALSEEEARSLVGEQEPQRNTQ